MILDETREVVLGILIHKGRVLMIERSVGDGVVWSFPGGKVEVGESVFEACAREMFEEVGLSCLPTRSLGKREHPTTARMIHYVLCDADDLAASNREPEKALSVSWLTLQEVEARVNTGLFPPVREELKRLGRSLARRSFS